MLRAGIIGCGMIAQLRHAPEYAQNPDCELAGCFDPRSGCAEAICGKFGGRAYSGLDELLGDASIDMVSVCTSNATHADITVKALESGKHVLCEKPMATNSADARRMVDAARASGRVLMIGHNQRLAPAHRLAKEILSSGRLGRVLSFQTAFSHGGPEHWLKQSDARSVWFFSGAQSAFGVLGDLGIHKIDLLGWLLDDEITDVQCFFGTLDKRFEDGTPVPVEDNAAMALRFRSGAVGTMLSSWTAYGAEDNSTVLNCEKGIMQIYRDGAQLRLILPDGGVEEYNPGAIQTNDAQTNSGIIDLFVNGVKAGVSPISGEEALRALIVLEKALGI